MTSGERVPLVKGGLKDSIHGVGYVLFSMVYVSFFLLRFVFPLCYLSGLELK